MRISSHAAQRWRFRLLRRRPRTRASRSVRSRIHLACRAPPLGARPAQARRARRRVRRPTRSATTHQRSARSRSRRGPRRGSPASVMTRGSPASMRPRRAVTASNRRPRDRVIDRASGTHSGVGRWEIARTGPLRWSWNLAFDMIDVVIANSDRDYRINLRDPVEVDFFCLRFGCSRKQLFAAAHAVGSTREALREYFANRARRPPTKRRPTAT